MKKNIHMILCLFIYFIIGCASSKSTQITNELSELSVEPGTTSIQSNHDSIDLTWNIEGSEFEVIHKNDVNISTISVNEKKTRFINLPLESANEFIIRSDTGEQTTAFAYFGLATSQPRVLSAKAYNGFAEITWQALPGISGYELYISVQESGNYTLISSLAKETSSATINGLTNGVTYYVKIVAKYAQSPKSTLTSLHNLSQQVLSVLPGYTFGEVTAVTPGTGVDKHSRVFKGYMRGTSIHFMWDAVPNAIHYNLYSAMSAEGPYTLIENIIGNFHDIELPLINKYYKVASVFADESEGPQSQYIYITHLSDLIWTIEGGIESVILNVENYSFFDNVILSCMEVGESEWMSTKVTKSPFAAGPLSGGYYDCKLILSKSKDTAESDTKRVKVHRTPNTHEKLSVYVLYNSATLRWDAFEPEVKYSVLLSTDGGKTVSVVANNLERLEYTLENLKCGEAYTAYISYNKSEESLTSSPVKFALDEYYCSSVIPPVEEESKNEIVKLSPRKTFARQYHANGVIDGKLYLFGGSVNSSLQLMNDTHVFTPSTNEWTKLTPTGTLPNARDFYSVGVINEKMYLFGGRGSTNNVWVFDPVASTGASWKKLSPSNAPRINHSTSSAIYKNKMYVFGGAYNETWIYSPEGGADGVWTKGAYGPTINSYHKSAIVIKDAIYLFGGTVATRGGSPTNELWKFIPDTNTWKKLNPSGTIKARGMHAAASVNNKMYVWSGDIGDHNFTNDLWVYDPDNGSEGSWTELKPKGTMPVPRRGSSIDNIDGKLYIFGGYNMATQSDMYLYIP